MGGWMTGFWNRGKHEEYEEYKEAIMTLNMTKTSKGMTTTTTMALLDGDNNLIFAGLVFYCFN